MALLLVASEPGEFDGILDRCQAVRKLDWPVWFARSAELNARPAVFVANGPGFRLASQAVEAALVRMEADAVVSTGFCGALDSELAPGDVFVAEEVVSGGEYFAARPPVVTLPFRSGRLVSIDRVIGTAEEKQKLAGDGVAAVDMESAAVARAARRDGIPLSVIRAVFDGPGEDFELDFNLMRGTDGRFSRWKICKAALSRPARRIGELWRLYRRGRLASRALGEFFGHCRF